MPQGFLVPESVIIDETNLRGKTLDSTEFKQFVITLRSILESHARALNAKVTGQYSDVETIPGKFYFLGNSAQGSNGFRVRVTTGALMNAGTTTTPHNIPIVASYRLRMISGVANDPVNLDYIPLPFVSVSGAITAGNIEVRVDAMNVYITTTGNGTNFTESYVDLEYTKF